MATAQALASLGLVSSPKTIVPRWSFIIGTFIVILLFIFGLVALILYLHQKNYSQRKFDGSNKNKGTIYYDKINDLESEDLQQTRWYSCLCRRVKQMVALNSSKVQPDQEVQITYSDLAALLQEFRDQMGLLKQ
jgi:hypothetical protein